MDKKYEKLIANMREVRNDDLFDPEELSSLTEEERKKAEYEIVFNVLYGNPNFFKFIPHLQTFNANDIKQKMDYQSLSVKSVIELDSQIYRATKDVEDLKRIIPIAQENPQAFYSLVKIYTFNSELKLDKNNEVLLPHLKKCIENNQDHSYETIFSNEVFKLK